MLHSLVFRAVIRWASRSDKVDFRFGREGLQNLEVNPGDKIKAAEVFQEGCFVIGDLLVIKGLHGSSLLISEVQGLGKLLQHAQSKGRAVVFIMIYCAKCTIKWLHDRTDAIR